MATAVAWEVRFPGQQGPTQKPSAEGPTLKTPPLAWVTEGHRWWVGGGELQTVLTDLILPNTSTWCVSVYWGSRDCVFMTLIFKWVTQWLKVVPLSLPTVGSLKRLPPAGGPVA